MWLKLRPQLTLKPTYTSARDAFSASLARFHRSESELGGRVLPADTDVEAAVDAAFQRFFCNPASLPL